MRQFIVKCAELCSDIYDDNNVTTLLIRNLKIGYRFSEDVLYIGICGTNDILDWIDNLKLIPKNGFHRGFYNIAIKLIDILAEIISIHNAKEIILCGHSSGGAIAQILSYLTKYPSISFAPPKCRTIFKKVHVTGISIYTNCDTVPKIPFILYRKIDTSERIRLNYEGNLFDCHKMITLNHLVKMINF